MSIPSQIQYQKYLNKEYFNYRRYWSYNEYIYITNRPLLITCIQTMQLYPHITMVSVLLYTAINYEIYKLYNIIVI